MLRRSEGFNTNIKTKFRGYISRENMVIDENFENAELKQEKISMNDIEARLECDRCNCNLYTREVQDGNTRYYKLNIPITPELANLYMEDGTVHDYLKDYLEASDTAPNVSNFPKNRKLNVASGFGCGKVPELFSNIKENASNDDDECFWSNNKNFIILVAIIFLVFAVLLSIKIGIRKDNGIQNKKLDELYTIDQAVGY